MKKKVAKKAPKTLSKTELLRREKQAKAITERMEKSRQDKDKKFLARKVILNIAGEDGKPKAVEISVGEMAHSVVYLQQGVDALQKFTLVMARHFYHTKPDHPFFKGCDEKFMAKLQEGIDPAHDTILNGAIHGENPRSLDKPVLKLAEAETHTEDTAITRKPKKD